MKTRTWMLIVAAGAACAAGVVTAQPDRAVGDQPPAETPGQPGEAGPGGLRMIRQRIEQRREQLKRAQERIDLALKLLDEGASIERVREEYPEFFRQHPGGGGPGGPEGGMGGGPEGMDPFDGPPGGRRPGGGEGAGMRGPGLDGGPERFDRSGGPGGGPGGGGERGRDRAGADRPPTEEERAAIREFLRVAQPRLFEMLQDLEKRDPEEAQRKLVEAFPRVRPMLDLRKADPEMFELRKKDLLNGREAMEAARWLAEQENVDSGASDADRGKRRELMKTALLAQFDARTEIQRRDLSRQEKRLGEAKAELETRAADRDKAIEMLMARMIERERERMRHGDSPDDGASPPPPPPGEGRRQGRRGDR